MRFITASLFTLFCALTATTHALDIPKDHPKSGIYYATEDAGGKVIFTPVRLNLANTTMGLNLTARAPTPSLPVRSAKFRRSAEDETGCGQSAVDITTRQEITAKVMDFCTAHGRIGKKTHIVVFGSKNVAGYLCNYTGSEVGCGAEEAYGFFGAINARCPNVEGWFFIKDWNKTFGYLSFQDRDKVSVCTNGA
jgi:hypothetical protein